MSPMSCGPARRLAWPEYGPRPATAEIIAAQAHLAACDACQRFLADMRESSRAIHGAASLERAPSDVRGRMFGAVARARAGQRRPLRWRRQAFAAVVAVAVVGAVFATADLAPPHRGPDALAALAADHVGALGDARITSNDSAKVERWVAQRVPFALHVPRLPGARLRGARLCVMQGRLGVALEYVVDGIALSYVVLPDGESRPPAGEPSFAAATRSGYGVVSWHEPGLWHVMIADLPAGELERLAKACVAQARRALAALRLMPSRPRSEA